MGILTIQFGQCGNQIGHALYSYLVNDVTNTKRPSVSNALNTEYIDKSTKRWFSEIKNSSYIPRSILVDTENKVVSSLSNLKDSLLYKNIIAKCDGGSANNWAFGYTVKGAKLLNEVKEKVRKELEKSDEITSIVSFLSSGGGTGSGTGSYVLESLREEYSNKTMINVIVLPYRKGEIVTQSYNTLLTLAKLYDITDGNIIFENDKLHRMCNALMLIKNVDLYHMNTLIAQKISAVLQPAGDNSIYNFVSELFSHPNYKFVQIKTTPHIAHEHMKYEPVCEWSVLAGHMQSSLRANKPLNPVSVERYRPDTDIRYQKNVPIQYYRARATGSLLISRGGTSPDTNFAEALMDKQFYPPWIPVDSRLKHFHQPRNLFDTDNFLALTINSNSICNGLDIVLDEAWALFSHKAYLHQYTKYGITETEFRAAFEKMESVLHNYKSL